jgi:16S rRNA (cytosine967-C5)-methyltransferase
VNRAFALARRALEGLGESPRGAKKELDRVLGGLRGADAPRASELVYGIVRRRRALHALLAGVARRSLKGRTAEVTLALELGGYALLYQEGEHAKRATEDALALVSGKKVKAHVERVLTAVAQALEEGAALPLDAAAVEGGFALPVRRGVYRRFRKPVLDVAGTSPARRLAILHSYPDELVAAWLEARGPVVAEELCWAGNDPPPLFARVSSSRTTPGALVALLATEEVTAEARPDLGPHVLELTGGRSGFREAPAFKAGLFVIQDATAQEVPRLLAPRAGERVLDLCAAPGGKTTYLAELALDQAKVLATDVSPGRLRKVADTAAKLGLRSIETRAVDARRQDALKGESFDAVLVDAPCSNTGVIRRRPEARWRYSGKSQRRIVSLASLCLGTGLRALAKGGRLVYSVCSIEPEEGPELLRAALVGTGLSVVEEITRFPGPRGGDGGYAGLVR